MYEILINPVSGKGKSLIALKTIESLLQQKKIEYNIHMTEYPHHATQIVKKLNEAESTNLIVLGGDGTFNEALNGITNFESIIVGFIPCGTGNDYVKSTSVPKDTVKALNLILEGNIGYTDFFQLDGKRALNCAGAGMDVDVLVRYSTMKAFKGKIKYYASLIDVLLHLRFHKMKINIDGVESEKSVFIAAIANGKYFGGGMPISPLSDTNDGVFNVVIVNEIKPRQVFGMLLKFLKGKHISEPCTETFTAKEITITLLDEGKTQVDGEVFENKELHCVIMHDILQTYK